MADRPRIDELEGRRLTVNEAILLRGIRHAHWIERLKTGEQNQVLSFLDERFLPDLEEQLLGRLRRIERRGFDTGPATTKRLNELRVWARGFLDEGVRDIYRGQKVRLQLIAKKEAVLEVEAVNRALPRELAAIEVGFVAPAASTLSDVVTSRPLQGRLLREWWGGLGRSTATALDSQIKIGILSGETTEQISARLFGATSDAFQGGTTGAMRRHATTITRTAVTGVTTEARERTYRENEELVQGVRIVATLDFRTTDICKSVDGKVFRVDEGPRPEFHHQCRTTTSPVMKSLKQLGITSKDVDLSASTRASMRGDVPAATTYGKWLRGETVQVQNEALGKARAELFRRGKVPIERFVDRKGAPLNINQLMSLERKIETGALGPIPAPLPGEIRKLSRLSA